MPKYIYECDSCAHEWGVWASVSDSPPSECPVCAQGSPFKILSKFVTMKKDKIETKSAKDNVVEHIEDNKAILKKMKQEARDKRK